MLRGVPSGDRDAQGGSRRDNQSDTLQTLHNPSLFPALSFAECVLPVLLRAEARLPFGKSRWCCVPPTEFHGTRGTSSRARPLADSFQDLLRPQCSRSKDFRNPHKASFFTSRPFVSMPHPSQPLSSFAESSPARYARD